MTEDKYHKRDVDYLGNLRRILADLTGFTTLAFELVQNADDAGADKMVFDVGEDALEVWNDAMFTDCGNQELDPDDCPLRDNAGHRCDFHSFRSVSSQDKQRRANTTGAFGIGFTAVYQITDQPELISAERHWIIDELQPADRRIRECGGCRRCQPSPSGTRFILPWARDPNSRFRKKLGVGPVDNDQPLELVRTLKEVLPTAILFLRDLDSIEILRNGVLETSIVRDAEADYMVVQVDGQAQGWHLLKGSFQVAANLLRDKHGAKIESTRSNDVTIAIPEDRDVAGHICAYLPTREKSGLPFHVNADLYLASDRTGLLEEGHRGEWNRAAIREAACVIARRLEDLRDPLGPARLWGLVLAAWKQRAAGGNARTSIWSQPFWEEIGATLPKARLVSTTAGDWVIPSEAILLGSLEDETPAIEFLESLGLSIALPDVQRIIKQGLPRAELLAMKELDLTLLVETMNGKDYDDPDTTTALPDDMLTAAWQELGVLLQRPGAKRSSLDSIALAPTTEGSLVPFGIARQADATTRRLFEGICPEVPFLDTVRLSSAAAGLADSVPEFSTQDAVELLSHAIDQTTRIDTEAALKILDWFAKRTYEIDDVAATRLAALPIFPGSGVLRPLDELWLPGDFEDELRLADILDTSRTGNLLPLLERLEARHLTFGDYVVQTIPANEHVAVEDPGRWRKVVELLARRLGNLQELRHVKENLTRLPLVETSDGFRSAAAVYFPSDEVGRVLPDSTQALPASEAVESLYAWLGVAYEPRLGDVEQRIRALASSSPTADSIAAVTRIVEHLAARDDLDSPPGQRLVRSLRALQWLPAERDESRWYTPDELAAVYRKYLFESQARFLDVPRPVQQHASTLLANLGVQTDPNPEQVVRHVLACAEEGNPVHKDVYRFLTDNVDDPSLDDLADRRCILAPNGRYLRPRDVFRGKHPFGRFRAALGSDLRSYDALWDRLGIRNTPEPQDAVGVLDDVAQEYGSTNKPLDEDALAVVLASWRIIEEGLDSVDDRMIAELRGLKCIPNADHVLVFPERALFDDAPEYADALAQGVGPMLIRKPEGAWRAMKAAGVLGLAGSVEVEIYEATDERDDTVVAERIDERRRQIARALDPLLSGETTQDALALLDELRFTAVSRLDIRYRLRLPGLRTNVQSDVLPTRVVLLHDRLFRRDSERIPAVDLARELARQLAPSVERAAVVPALALALGPETAEEADGELDSAGVPRLEESLPGGVDPAVLDELGGINTPTDTTAEQPAPSIPNGKAPEAPDDQESTAADRTPLDTGDRLEDTRQADRAAGPIPADSGNTRRRAHPRQQPRSTSSQRGTFLRSYVSPLDPHGSDERPSRANDERGKADDAGIRAVLHYERSQGREPTQMPHHHPGYDIESRNSEGEIVRYIEVKSLSGEWTGLGAGVSARQYRTANELGDRFWLYVVEHAVTEPRLFAIHNPIDRADQFMFDDNWKLLADPRQRPIPDVEVVLGGTHGPVGEWTDVPLVHLEHVLRRGQDKAESVDGPVVAVPDRRTRFVCEMDDDTLWLMADAPRDRDGRLLLVEHVDDAVGSVPSVAWYRSFSTGGRLCVELTPPDGGSQPLRLFPTFEDDVAVHAEVVGRGRPSDA